MNVRDTNDNAPQFDQEWYQVDVGEGQLYTQIERVHATDADCDSKFGEICKYTIENGDQVPFAIDDDGTHISLSYHP